MSTGLHWCFAWCLADFLVHQESGKPMPSFYELLEEYNTDQCSHGCRGVRLTAFAEVRPS